MGRLARFAEAPGLPEPTHKRALSSANGLKMSDTAVLDAEATDYLRVTTVQFLLTGGTLYNAVDRGRPFDTLRMDRKMEHGQRRKRHLHSAERRVRRCR